MKKITLVSYPSDQSNLLSLCDHQSRYELMIGGRFMILDFILSIALSIKVNEIILLEERVSESLKAQCEDETTFAQFPPIKIEGVHSGPYNTLLINLLQHNKSDYILFMNGDNPVIGDLQEIVSRLVREDVRYGIIKVSFKDKPLNTTELVLIKKDVLLDYLRLRFDKAKNLFSLITDLIGLLKNENTCIKREISGYYHSINNIVEYYNTNMEIIKWLKPMAQLFQTIPLGNMIPTFSGEGIIRKQAQVIDSILTDSCQVYGHVYNSILFPKVTVSRKAKVMNSIILPNTIIGERSTVTRSIIDETFESTINLPTIGEECVIGREGQSSRNTIYPKTLYNGITLIGPNCTLPKRVKVGAACYIKGGTDKQELKKNSVVKDSETI